MSEKTYGQALQTALQNASELSYNKRVFLVSEEDQREIDVIAKDLISQHKNIIIIHEVELEESEDAFSNGVELELYSSMIYVVNKAGVFYDKTNFLNLPIFGSPKEAVDLSTMADNVKTVLHNNKLSGDFLNLGGGIVSTEQARTLDDVVSIKANVHNGRRATI